MASVTGQARVVLFSDSDVVGGAERSMLHLAAAHRGPQQLAIAGTSPRLLAEAARLAPAVPRHPVPAAAGVRGVLALRRALRALRPDLLQLNLSSPFLSRGALVAARLAGIPVVAVEHLVLPSRRRRGAILQRAMSGLTRAQVAVGDASARDLHRFFGIPERSITVIHNGLPDDEVVAVHHATGPVVGCAARLEDQKQLDVLVEAVARLHGPAGGPGLVIVGDGSRRDDLTRLAGRRGIAASTHMVGWVDDARPHIAGFDVFALPSRAEAFPLTIVEAMLLGVPVVATDVGSVGEAVADGRTGLLVPSGDAGALAAAIARLLADGDLRTSLATEARRVARERFTSSAMADAYQRLWQRLLDRPPRRFGLPRR